ncbi:MAG: sulfatase-like hydrolase/transferase, partial [Puniceicoccales bacterium]|nr:sulfatase-like hydrolase/transferase [Puniceicoccales bacterium]
MSRNALILFGVLGGAFHPMSGIEAEKQRTPRPNVIYIYADDLGKGLLSAYGQKQFKTPHIDALINQGVSFSNAYGCMLCAPARASLLTGYHDCHPDKWRISGGGQFINQANIEQAEKRLDAQDIRLKEGDYYLPQVFKQVGYTTAQIGKLEWGFTATRQQMK